MSSSSSSQASIAKCNICSTFNRNIVVVCENRCLMCIRCQTTPTIRRLFLSSPTECPLCEFPMSRTMIRLIHTFASVSENGNSINTTFDLEEMPSPFGAFIKRYRNTYPSNGEIIGYQLSEQEMRELDSSGTPSQIQSTQYGNIGSRPSSPGGLTLLGSRPTSPGNDNSPTGDAGGASSPFSSSLPAIVPDRSAASIGGGGGGTATATDTSTLGEVPVRGKAKKETGPEQTIYAITPQKFTVLNVLDFALECYSLLWQVLGRSGNESLPTIAVRFCSKKKLSQRSNDFKLMGLLHFYCEAGGSGSREALSVMESSPHVILFGKCLGLLPRRQRIVRKAWGSIAISVLAFASIEKCWRTAELIDAEGNPSPADLKQKLNKLQSNRPIPVKRAIKLVLMMGESCQPHWTMAPVLSASQEYNSRTPWTPESMSRVLHMLLFAALWVNGKITPEPGAGAAVAAISGGGRDARDFRDRDRKEKDKDKREEEEGTSIVGVKLLRALTSKAKNLWNARAHNSPSPVQVSEVARITPTGTFAFLSTERAAELAGKMTMGACELALVCVDAWEAEYKALQRDMQKALISSTRRTAVIGCYDNSHASLTKIERLSVLRLLKWHNELGHLGIDWASIKSRSETSSVQIFPFHVPPSLLSKSVAELNFHSEIVTHEFERDKAKEFVEDFVAATGPFTKVPTRLPLSRSGRSRDRLSVGMGGTETALWDEEPVLGAEEIKASHRQDYLAGQMLGDDASEEHKETGEASESNGKDRERVRHDWEMAMATRPNSAAVPLALNEMAPETAESLAGQTGGPPSSADKDEQLSRDFIQDTHELRHHVPPTSPIRPPSTTADRPMYFNNRARPPLLQPLSTVPYSSPLPARHTVSLVDVLDNDASLLEKVRLLSAIPVGPGTGKARLRSLDDELFGSLEDDTNTLSSAADPATNTSSPTSTSTKIFNEQQSAKQRVWAKMEAEKQRKIQIEATLRTARLQERAEKAKRAAEEPLIPRNTEYSNKVDIRAAMDMTGKKPNSGFDSASVESALAREKAVQLLQLTDSDQPVPGAIGIEIAESFLKPFQLECLRKIDFTNAKIGPVGGTAMARAFTSHCALLDLRLGGCNLGDSACLRILQAIATGGGSERLLVLDLSNNNLTMITDGLAGLSRFTHLTLLDLSYNKLTLDLPRHHATFTAALSQLHDLQALSLAHNNIQDTGFTVLSSILLAPNTLSKLSFLDVRGCFLTPLSYPNLARLISETSNNSTPLQAAPSQQQASAPATVTAPATAPAPAPAPATATATAKPTSATSATATTATRVWSPAGIQLHRNIFTVEQTAELTYLAHTRDVPLFLTGTREWRLWEAVGLPYSPDGAGDGAGAGGGVVGAGGGGGGAGAGVVGVVGSDDAEDGGGGDGEGEGEGA